MRSELRTREGSLALATVVSMLLSSAALAQSANQDESALLQEVVVTATRRDESAQSVPLAITAVRGEQIAALNIGDQFGIAKLAPSLAVESAVGPSAPRWRMRGVGSNALGANAQSAVGVYTDDVLMGSGYMQGFLMYDLDRVEVLRGPQGTLFGRNNTGGAIHFVSRRPTTDLEGYARVQVGADSERNLEGAVGGALIGDKLLGRASFASRKRDGQYHNLYNGKDIGGYDRYEARVQLVYKLDNGGEWYFKAYSGESDFSIPLRHIGLLPDGTNFQGFSLPDDDSVVSLNNRNDGHLSRSGVTAQLKLPFSNGMSLTTIASVDEASTRVYFDDDASPLANFFELTGGDNDQTSVEIRLASADTQRFRWILGTYYLDSEVRGVLAAPYQSSFNFPTEGAAFDILTDSKSYAAFASGAFDITPQLTLRAGARYTRDKVKASGQAWSYAIDVNDPYNDSNRTLVYLDLDAGILRNAATGDLLPGKPRGDKWSKVTGDLTLEYKPTNDVLIFARAARGYRAGNVNAYIFTGTDFGLYNPEVLKDVELGFKSTFLDGRLRLNGTAFFYKFTDMQVTIVASPGSRTENAAEAKVRGFELEAEMQLTPELYGSLSYGYQDSEYSEFSGASAPFPVNLGQPLDLTGQSFERAPKDTINALLRFSPKVGPGRLVLSTDWRYTSRYRFQPWSDAPNLTPAPFLQAPGVLQRLRDAASVDSMWVGNASITYQTGDGRFEFGVWGKNITDRFMPTSAFGMFFNRSFPQYVGERRSYGVSLTYNFGDR